jgi:hypothetical protein
VSVRRYVCRDCGAVVAVGPAVLLPGRHFSGPAIALALGLFGLGGLSAAEVRELVSPWMRVGATAARTWASLRRWARAVREARLFDFVRPCPPSFTLRQVAARAAQTLAASAPVEHAQLDLAHQAFFGAAHLAMASKP